MRRAVVRHRLMQPGVPLLPELGHVGMPLAGIRPPGFGDDMLRLGGIKIFADGTLGSQTAAMLESFENNPGNRGILTIPEQEMKETVSAAAEMGISIAIHAIGDRAARVALDAIEQAQQHLVNHNPGVLSRKGRFIAPIADGGLSASPLPINHHRRLCYLLDPFQLIAL